ncbi:MAG TPA: hypothetical protein VLK29_04500 [Luteimonas sp.]|nr:hypothetical protein [Luteimonas sp.]
MNTTYAAALNSTTATATTRRVRPTSFLSQAIAGSGPREPRVRDFGVGYGNSSGYAASRRYAGGGSGTRFRFA